MQSKNYLIAKEDERNKKIYILRQIMYGKFITTLFTIGPNWQNYKYMAFGEWVKIM